jgi:NACHT domain
MFRWYENASKCYVYLSDVSISRHAINSQSSAPIWQAAFRRSRWFSRGWTLQELIAPASVEFFSREGHRLGSKRSLEKHIHDITGIAIGALRGGSLKDFGVEERFSWAKHRETKRQEDKAYSLLGIFNIQMSPRYGEGGEEAFMRLRNKIDKSSKRKWDSYVGATPIIQDTSQDYQLLKSVSHIGDAAYDSYENQRHRPCLTNTRVDLLRKITGWATCCSSQYIFWLRGRAGTGKSTIALTIAQSLDQHDTPLASFFFKRRGGDLARSRMVISTIAFQLAIRSSLLGSLICEALREHPNLGDSASLSQQYEKLLLRPLQKARQSATNLASFIVVLDALDECNDLDDVRLLLRLLGDAQNMAGLGLRVLIISRPEIPIRLGFHNMKHIAYHELALDDISRETVDHDIEKFVTHELAQIQADRSRTLPNSWPEHDKIRTITSRADGLFIYAATVCRYVNGPRQVSVSARLDQVCRGSAAKHRSTDVLDEMYLMVLDSSMKGDFSADEAQEVTLRLRQVVGSVVLLLENLSAKELARLLFSTVSTGEFIVQETLDPLHAVLDVPEDSSKPIQMLHLSFRDFLIDSARCPDVGFQINQQQAHYDLSDRCLDLMEQCLVQKICQLPGPGVFVDGVSEAALRQYLPFGLRYACRHWISHAEYGGMSLSDNGRVNNFLRQCCHYWMEVMSLIGKIPEATTIMIQLESLIDVSTTIQSIENIL